jgi:transposase
MGKKGEKMVHVVTGLEEMEGARRATGISSNERARGSAGATTVPDPEVRENAVRRRFTAEYKRKVLRAADACREPGDLGALLRREGLYSSNLTTWRRQADRGTLDALTPKKRGPKVVKPDPSLRRIAELEKENQKLSHTLRQAQSIIEAQKKIAEILQTPVDPKEEKRS